MALLADVQAELARRQGLVAGSIGTTTAPPPIAVPAPVAAQAPVATQAPVAPPAVVPAPPPTTGVTLQDVQAELARRKQEVPSFITEISGPEAFAIGAGREIESFGRGARQIGLNIRANFAQDQAIRATGGAGLLRLLGFDDAAQGLDDLASEGFNLARVETPQAQKEIVAREQESERLFAPLAEERPIATGAGRIATAAVPFAAAAPVTLAGAAGIGALEGALQFAETDSDRVINAILGGFFGAAGQKAFDVIEQFGGNIIAKVRNVFNDQTGTLVDSTSGALTDKGNDAIIKATGADTLDEAKKLISEDTIKAVDASLKNKIPEVELRRKVLSEQFGITEPRRSLLTGSSADQAVEQELLKIQDPDFLALRSQEEQAFKNSARQNIENVSGAKLPDNFDRGDIEALKEGLSLDVDDFLTNLKSADLAEIDNLYGIAREQSGNVLPVEQAGILTKFKDQFREVSGQFDAADRRSIFGGIREALQDTGVIPKTKETIEAKAKELVKEGAFTPEEAVQVASQIEPLTLGKAQDLIKRLNAVSRNSKIPVTKKVVSEVKEAIFDSIDEIATKNELGADAAKAFTDARAARRAHAENFEPQIMDRLTGFRADDVTPKVPAEKMFNEISKASIEDISRVKANLSRAGAPGRQLWNRIQAQNALEMLGKSLTGKTDDGTLMISGAKLKSAMGAIGPRRLSEMFNKSTLDNFRLISNSKAPATLNEGVYTPSGVQAERGAKSIVEAVNGLATKAAIFNFDPVTATAMRAVSSGKEKARGKAAKKLRKIVINPNITADVAANAGSLSPNGLIAARLIGGIRAAGIATPIIITENAKDAVAQKARELTQEESNGS